MLKQDSQSQCATAYSHFNAGRVAEARMAFNLVLAADPRNVAAIEGLALIGMSQGDLPAARDMFERALQVTPDSIDTRLNLADLLLRLGEFSQARAHAEQVISGKPNHLATHYLLGQIDWARGAFDEAFASYERANMDLIPDLLATLEYRCHQRLGDADWRGYDAQVAFFKARLRAGRQVWQPTFQLLSSSSPRDIARAMRIYAARQHPARPPMWKGERWSHDRIRIGILTAELYDHPVGNLLAGVLAQIDRTAFKLVGFSYGPHIVDKTRERLIPLFDECLDVRLLDDASIAGAIRGREIDIAVTLNGYTLNARADILAYRPAPVQVSYMGFPSTMGVSYIDYLIADRHVIPKRDQEHYDEKIVWMPDSYQATDDRADIAERTPTRAEEGLPDDAFVFMAYNHANKVTPAMFDIWMRILGQVEGSVLWLPVGEAATSGNLRGQAAARGIDPDRLVFAARNRDRPDHIARHRLADLFLDSLPYNAHSTASDALWAGLPVLTCRGATFPGRVCAGLLTVAGMADMITENLQDYERTAVALACNADRLAAIRRRVAEDVRKTPLFDTQRYVRNLEAAFRAMHEASQAGRPPRSFEV